MTIEVAWGVGEGGFIASLYLRRVYFLQHDRSHDNEKGHLQGGLFLLLRGVAQICLPPRLHQQFRYIFAGLKCVLSFCSYLAPRPGLEPGTHGLTVEFYPLFHVKQHHYIACKSGG